MVNSVNQMGQFDGRPLVWSAAPSLCVCLLQSMLHVQAAAAWMLCTLVLIRRHCLMWLEGAIGAIFLFKIILIITTHYMYFWQYV